MLLFHLYSKQEQIKYVYFEISCRIPTNKCEMRLPIQRANMLNGGMMHFQANNPFMKATLEEIQLKYWPHDKMKWVVIGPPLLSNVAASFMQWTDKKSHNVTCTYITLSPIHIQKLSSKQISNQLL